MPQGLYEPRQRERLSGGQRGGFAVKPATSALWTTVSSLSDAREWQRDAWKQLNEVRALPADWDGYGSPVMSERSFQQACKLIFAVEVEYLPTPHLGPESGGAVQFDWCNGRHALELHFLADGTVSYLKTVNGDCEADGELPANAINEWRSLVEWLQEG